MAREKGLPNSVAHILSSNTLKHIVSFLLGVAVLQIVGEIN